MIALLTFHLPLLRLILCGGGGLPSAWGPLKHADEDYKTPWYPTFGTAIVSSDEGRGYLHADPLEDPDEWSIPLDAASPWVARLALIAAWILDAPSLAAWIGGNDFYVMLTIVTPNQALIQRIWGRRRGARCSGSVPVPELPTLPTYLAAHPPVVALLLALYDVPEIRARVDAVRP